MISESVVLQGGVLLHFALLLRHAPMSEGTMLEC